MSTISTNMNLIVPTVGTTPGPDWASDLNSSLTLIDSHDHTPGKGVPITPSGISINSDLSFQSYNATNLRSSRYTSQASTLVLATDITCVYVAAGNLWYNNASGTAVQLTNGNSLAGAAGTITGLPSGTASASYGAGTFTWQAATNTPATMDQGSTIIRELVAGGKGATLQVVAGLVADYTIVLPQLPASQKIMTLDNSGNMTAPYTVDGSSITISSNVIGIGALGVTSAMLAAGSVTNSKLGPLAVTAAKIDTAAVETLKIADGNVTPQKRSTAIQASGTTALVNGVASASATIVRTGRPVLVCVSMDNPAATVIGQPTITGAGTGQLLVSKAGIAAKDIRTVSTTSISFDSWQWIDTSGTTGSTAYGLISSAGNIAMNGTNVLRISVMEL